MKATVLVTVTAGVFGIANPVYGQNVALAGLWTDGTLSTTFANGGKGVYPFPGTAYGMAVDSQGRVVVAGTASGPQISIARFRVDGSVDTTFGTNGLVLTNISGGATGRAVAMNSQDQIIVAGQTNGNLNVVRFDENGTQLYSPYCPATTSANWSGEAFAVTIDGSGRIIAAGTRTSGAQADRQFLVARFIWGTCPDPNFNDGRGIHAKDASGGATYNWEQGKAVAVDGSGNILVAGPLYWHNENGSGGGAFMAVLCFLDNGSLDTSFGYSGIATVLLDSAGTQELAVNAILIGGSQIWVGGWYDKAPKLARFDMRGHNTLLKNTAVHPNALIATHSNDGLIMGGYTGSRQFAITEYNWSGALVQSFGTSGVQTVDANCAMSSSVYGLGRQSTWAGLRIIAAGPSGPNACQ